MANASPHKKNLPLNASKFHLAAQCRNEWVICPEHGTLFESVLEPDYWAHVAFKLRPNDKIEVMPEDGSYYALLMVTDSARLWAKVVTLLHSEFGSAPVKRDERFDIAWGGLGEKYRVIRTSDKAVLAKGFQRREGAEQWLDKYLHEMS